MEPIQSSGRKAEYAARLWSSGSWAGHLATGSIDRGCDRAGRFSRTQASAWLSVCSLAILSFSINAVASECFKWHSLGTKKIHGVSGISAIDENRFLVIHDRKKDHEPRLGIVTWKRDQAPSLTHIPWCTTDNLPVDLEAMTAIPNQHNEYLVLESKGVVTRIELKLNNGCNIISQFTLPTATLETNMEGLAAYCSQDDCVLAWAERGDETNPAKLSWAKFDIANNQLHAVENEAFEFDAPYPKNRHRSISDLSFDNQGNLWASSTFDPSDTGPFKSAIYNLGYFIFDEGEIEWEEADDIEPIVQYTHDNVKIEGLFFLESTLIMVSEDEDLGGKIARKRFIEKD